MPKLSTSYVSIITSGMKIVCVVAGAAAIIMLSATALDCFLNLGWQWDCANVWISPIIIAICCIIYFAAWKMQHWFGGH